MSGLLTNTKVNQRKAMSDFMRDRRYGYVVNEIMTRLYRENPRDYISTADAWDALDCRRNYLEHLRPLRDTLVFDEEGADGITEAMWLSAKLAIMKALSETYASQYAKLFRDAIAAAEAQERQQAA